MRESPAITAGLSDADGRAYVGESATAPGSRGEEHQRGGLPRGALNATEASRAAKARNLSLAERGRENSRAVGEN